MSDINLILMTDSYKASHYLQYPEGTEGVFSYIESRGGRFDETLFFGLQMFLMKYMQSPISKADIDVAERFFRSHGEPFHREGWEHILSEHNGKFPVIIKAAPEGAAVPVRNVLLTIENTCAKCYWTTSYLETTLLRAVWYPTTVATVSWHCKKILRDYMEASCDTLDGLEYKLHDFGARGVSSHESASIGGAAHLVNFKGSDTVEGVIAANLYYRHGMAGVSIPAGEHSTICCWGKENEVDAYRNMLRQFARPGSLVSVVSDSYNIYDACARLWGEALKNDVIDSGAIIIIRPDSGDPCVTVRRCLGILGDKFGYTWNSKSYRVLNNVRVIQGDGININTLDGLCKMILDYGWSLDNVNFGMGGGLLQQLDRDTCEFAMKCSAVKVQGEWRDAYKDPVEGSKVSKRGRISLYQKGHGRVNLFTATEDGMGKMPDELRVHMPEMLIPVYANGDILVRHTLDDIRARARIGLAQGG